MKFEPRPANDFRDFYQTYSERCRERVPGIRAVAAKWAFEDLIPGLSDFDTRFLVRDPMTAGDWTAMSLAVGEVHAEMTREFNQWARNLEHLPGINLTEEELLEPLFFYPEFEQWTFYEGDESYVEKVRAYFSVRPWSRRDELFQLKKIAVYFGPYVRGIDPAINIGPFGSKYPLHSRYLHYFAPPVQAAVSLYEQHNVRGKLDALRMARERFPHPDVIDRILESIDRHYEIPEDYEDTRLTRIERTLEQYLEDMWVSLRDHLTLLEPEKGDSRDDVRRKVNAVPVDAMERFFEGIKFSRLMKGRLLFYAESIPWFESDYLIRNELGRIVTNFFEKPFTVYGEIRFGEMLPPERVVDRVRGSLLDEGTCDELLAFADLAGRTIDPGEEKNRAREVAAVFDAVVVSAEELTRDLLERIAG